MTTITHLPTGYPERAPTLDVELASGLDRRWSPVRFDADEDVTDVDLKAVLEAARWAPSSFGEEPWRFLVARRDDPWRGRVESALREGNAWARRASVLLVGTAKRTYTLDGRTNRHAAHDLGLALSGIMAEAMARGLVTHAMGGFDPDQIRNDFAVPDDFDVLWVTALGHHDPALDEPGLVEREGRPRRRKPLEDTVFGPRFGQSMEV